MNPHLRPVLFGAFDRHNFGDLLFPHLAAAMLPGRGFAIAGLAARDLSAFGGHRVVPLAPGATPLVHAGGELLTCSAWQAAVMLRPPTETAGLVAHFDADPAAAEAWAAEMLGTARAMPYVAGRGMLAPGGRLIFNAVGGVEWHGLTHAQREEVKAALREADWLSVRDRVTQAALQTEGIAAPLCPDPAVMLAECFGDRIAQRQRQGAVQAMRETFPQGYLACQFSADFADDASLDAVATNLGATRAATGLGLALFVAGTAPWHDDPALYARLLHRLPPGAARIFPSLEVWDICALIAASRGTLASSLHARLVALAYALPRASLTPPQLGERPSKTAAFAATWEPAALPGSVAVHELAAAALRALAVPPDVLRDTAATLCARYRASLHQWSGLLPPAAGAQ
ncbi:MAG: polysaccharide pyruvyl transferase family protein [Pseudomonadota bacterium]